MSPTWRSSTSTPCCPPGLLPSTRGQATDHPADLGNQQGVGCSQMTYSAGARPFPTSAAGAEERTHFRAVASQVTTQALLLPSVRL